jgi:hypothetical protein
VPSYPAVTFYGVLFLYNKPNVTMEVTTEPLLELLHGANEKAKTTLQVAWAPSWISVFDTLPSEGSAGGGGAASASRLLSESALTEDIEKLARVLELIGPSDEASKVCSRHRRIDVSNAYRPAYPTQASQEACPPAQWKSITP